MHTKKLGGFHIVYTLKLLDVNKNRSGSTIFHELIQYQIS